MGTDVNELDLPFLDLPSVPTRAEGRMLIDAARRGDHWLVRTPGGYLITTYEDSVALLRDRRFHQFAAKLPELAGPDYADYFANSQPSILTTEGDAHGRLRRIVAPAFTPKAADRYRPFMREVMDRLLDPFVPTGRIELVRDVCEPYPIPIICRLLGAPEDDWKLFSRWAADLLRIFNFNFAEDLPFIRAARDEVSAYVRELIERRRRSPGDDLLTDLIAAEEAGDRLSTDELLSMAVAVLIAGTDTTRNQLGCTVALFTDHPDQWALLADHPELAPRAVEEAMRYLGAIGGTARFASEDVEFKGVLFPKDTTISTSFAAANRDEHVFAAPETFDITRESSSPHLTFGSGIHYCLGAWLAPRRAAGGAAHPGPAPARPGRRRRHRMEAQLRRHLGPGPFAAHVRRRARLASTGVTDVVRVGVLGCGNVGGALVALVAEQADAIEARTGLRLEIAAVAVRNLSRERDVELSEGVLTRDSAAVVADPDIDIVVEVIGGIEPARELILAALAAGKPVVTANKELLANVGTEVFAAAATANRDLLFEAAVAGGIPIVRVLRESLRGEPIRRVMGIVNGTTNYILTKMSRGGRRLRRRPRRGAAPRLRRARPDCRRRGLRRRRQGRHHRRHRLRGEGGGRRRLPRGHQPHHPRRHRRRPPPRLRREAARHLRAHRRPGRQHRVLGGRAGPSHDGAQRPSAGQRARQLQRRVRRGRCGGQPHVLRPGRRRPAHRQRRAW